MVRKWVCIYVADMPDMFVLGRQSCYLFGRDKTVVDIPIEHPSCSKQHAVIQFRQVTKRNEFGDEKRYVQYVYVTDLHQTLLDRFRVSQWLHRKWRECAFLEVL